MKSLKDKTLISILHFNDFFSEKKKKKVSCYRISSRNKQYYNLFGYKISTKVLYCWQQKLQFMSNQRKSICRILQIFFSIFHRSSSEYFLPKFRQTCKPCKAGDDFFMVTLSTFLFYFAVWTETNLNYLIADPHLIKLENPLCLAIYSLIDPLLVMFSGVLTREVILL